MPPVKPMLAKAAPSCPPARAALRAQVGRLPLHRLPRRRRGGAGQPQRAAADPVLPRAGRRGEGEAARALRGRRRDRHRPRRPAGLRGAAAAHPPGRSPGSTCWPSETPASLRRLRPAGAGRRVAARTRRSPSAGRALETALARCQPARPPHRRHHRPGDRAALVHHVRGRRARRRRRQAAGPALRAGQAADVQGQARAHRRLRGRRLPLAQERADRRLAAARPLRRRRAACSTSASRRRSRWPARAELVEELAPYRAEALDGHPWQDWAKAQSARGRRAPDAGRGQPVERRQGPVLGAAAPRAGGRGRVRPAGGRRFRHTGQFLRWRPDRDPRSCTYDQLERAGPLRPRRRARRRPPIGSERLRRRRAPPRLAIM